MLSRRLLVGSAPMLSVASPAATFPERPVRIVVPVPPGSVPDIIARLLAERLAAHWGVAVPVENRGGAGGAIGVEAALRAPADGHTLLLGSSGPIAILPAVRRALSYDPRRDLAAVARVADFPLVFLASRQSGMRDFAGLVDRARAAPLDYAGGDVGSTQHLAGALLAAQAGLELHHVPYRGGGLAQADLIAGRIALMVDSLSAVLRSIRDGLAVPLAVCGAARSDLMAAVPTVAECGVAGYAASGWMGLFVPAATPPALVRRLGDDVLAVLAEAGMAGRIRAVGSDPVTQPGAEFAAFVAEEMVKWRGLAQRAGITTE